jgi:hypothetical protein
MLTAGLPHTATLLDSRTLLRTLPDRRTLPRTLPRTLLHCRTQPCALPHTATHCCALPRALHEIKCRTPHTAHHTQSQTALSRIKIIVFECVCMHFLVFILCELTWINMKSYESKQRYDLDTYYVWIYMNINMILFDIHIVSNYLNCCEFIRIYTNMNLHIFAII